MAYHTANISEGDQEGFQEQMTEQFRTVTERLDPMRHAVDNKSCNMAFFNNMMQPFLKESKYKKC